jgi:hypothetical protein
MNEEFSYQLVKIKDSFDRKIQNKTNDTELVVAALDELADWIKEK